MSITLLILQLQLFLYQIKTSFIFFSGAIRGNPQNLNFTNINLTHVEDFINNFTAHVATTEDPNIASTTQFTMTRPANWWDFFPDQPRDCGKLYGKVYLHFNLNTSYFNCYCFGLEKECAKINEFGGSEHLDDRFDKLGQALVNKLFLDNIELKILVYVLYGLVALVGILGE